ncbi:uncharacterized protein TNCV_1632851 [Trichonephila clavipes]|nr:uncharacterized protein TNCV_1632851 [Trichonephila clavipes]
MPVGPRKVSDEREFIRCSSGKIRVYWAYPKVYQYTSFVYGCMGTRLKNETEKKNLCDGKRQSGRYRLTDSLISKIQRYYRMAIRNNINYLYSIKTAVWAVYFHLLSSNESPQHGLYHAIINAWCKFQKIEAECNERHYVINTHVPYTTDPQPPICGSNDAGPSKKH